jgi:adenylylsulfate kinase-like enzyme
LFEPDDFLEVFIDTPLAVAEERDPKGLYKKARSGKLPNFTGIDSEYQPPINPSLILETEDRTVAESAKVLVELISIRAEDK